MIKLISYVTLMYLIVSKSASKEILPASNLLNNSLKFNIFISIWFYFILSDICQITLGSENSPLMFRKEFILQKHFPLVPIKKSDISKSNLNLMVLVLFVIFISSAVNHFTNVFYFSQLTYSTAALFIGAQVGLYYYVVCTNSIDKRTSALFALIQYLLLMP